MVRGVLAVEPLITHRFPVSEVRSAFPAAANRTANLIKAVVEPRNG